LLKVLDFIAPPHFEDLQFFEVPSIRSVAHHLFEQTALRVSVVHCNNLGTDGLVDVLDWVNLGLSIESSKQESRDFFNVFKNVNDLRVLGDLVLLDDDFCNLVAVLLDWDDFEELRSQFVQPVDDLGVGFVVSFDFFKRCASELHLWLLIRDDAVEFSKNCFGLFERVPFE